MHADIYDRKMEVVKMILNAASYTSKIKSFIDNNKTNKLSETTENASTKQQIFEEIRAKMKANLKDALDPTSNMTDEEKANYEMKINQKIKNGEKLSNSEMQFIRIKSPYMYALISRVQLQRQMLEEKLKNCRSKEEVEDAYNSCISHIDKDDPAKKPLFAAYTNVTQEFKKSSNYKSLPQKTEEEKDKDKLILRDNPNINENEIGGQYYYHDHKYTSVDMRA